MSSHPLDTEAELDAFLDSLGRVSMPLVRSIRLCLRSGARMVHVEAAHSEEWMQEAAVLKELGETPTDTITRLSLTRTPKTDDPSDLVGTILVRDGAIRSVLLADVPCYEADSHVLGCQDVAPFKQQDAVAGACAHASVFMGTLLLERRFPGAVAVGPQDIRNTLTTWAFPADTPSEGLNVVQIKYALESAGFRTRHYDFESKRVDGEFAAADQFVYRYVESGFPVLLGLQLENPEEFHSLLAVGHGFDQNAWWPGVQPSYYPSAAGKIGYRPSALWVPDLVVHDDNFGAYLNVSRGSIRRRAVSMIAMIPEELDLQVWPEAAELLAAARVVVAVGSDYAGCSQRWAPWVQRAASSDELVLRPILISGAELRQHYSEAAYDPAVVQLAAGAFEQEWLWMVEVSVASLFSERLKLGEVLLLPSVPLQPLQPLGEYVLLVHLPGWMHLRDGQTVEVMEDSPTWVFSRHWPAR